MAYHFSPKQFRDLERFPPDAPFCKSAIELVCRSRATNLCCSESYASFSSLFALSTFIPGIFWFTFFIWHTHFPPDTVLPAWVSELVGFVRCKRPFSTKLVGFLVEARLNSCAERCMFGSEAYCPNFSVNWTFFLLIMDSWYWPLLVTDGDTQGDLFGVLLADTLCGFFTFFISYSVAIASKTCNWRFVSLKLILTCYFLKVGVIS